jgi:PGF-pre-PGF domain-containing protein
MRVNMKNNRCFEIKTYVKLPNFCSRFLIIILLFSLIIISTTTSAKVIAVVDDMGNDVTNDYYDNDDTKNTQEENKVDTSIEDSSSSVDTSIAESSDPIVESKESLSDETNTIDNNNDNTPIDSEKYIDDSETNQTNNTNLDDEQNYDNNYSSSENKYNLTNDSNERIVSNNEIVSISENETYNLSTGEDRIISLENSDETNILSIELTPAKNMDKVKVTVIKLRGKPDEIIEISSDNSVIYKYYDIKLYKNDEFIRENEIQLLNFSFKVNLTWILEKNIEKNSISMMRYHDGRWDKLDTILINEDETYIYFKAETPGCSTFAVIGSEIIESSQPYSENGLDIPWSILSIAIIICIIGIVAILFKSRFIYIEK